MILPSEALKREFVLGDDPMPERVQRTTKSDAIHTHAVVVGDFGLLLPAGEVSELVEGLTICKLPNTPIWFSGVTSVRGNITTIFDLHDYFVVKPRGNGPRRMIVVGTNETAVAFWVDELPRMMVLRKQDTVADPPPLPSLLNQHVREYFSKEDQIWIDWDVQGFFTALGEQL